jgi:AcrR family transcriptional regulator
MTPRSQLDRATVISAATRLADAEGLEAVTLKRVAGDLGVRTPSLYAYVDGFEDLLRGIGVRAGGELVAALGEATAGRSGFDALSAMCTAYRDYARRRPGAFAATQRSSDLALDKDAQASGEAVLAVAMDVVRRSGLDGDEAIHAVRILRVAIHGFVELEAAGGFELDLSTDETFERMVAVLGQGFGRWTS